MAVPAAYGSSQARGQIGVAAEAYATLIQTASATYAVGCSRILNPLSHYGNS